MTKTSIMIQARMGSERFPKKVLASIEGKPLLWHVINRVKNVKNIDQIILLTTENDEDESLLKIAQEFKIKKFVGSEKNVLNRYYECAKKYDADPIIRITADCPLIDPFVVNNILKGFKRGDYDYASNCLPYTLPDGLDTEIFSFKTLEKMEKNSTSEFEREHVTTYLRNNINNFKIYNYENEKNFSNYKWSVDYENDLEIVRKIYELMRPKLIFSFNEVFDKIFQMSLEPNQFGLIDN
jgi:spore coat polysaccharide biosynthesis protein SpsF (cytidylyltransferase family)